MKLNEIKDKLENECIYQIGQTHHTEDERQSKIPNNLYVEAWIILYGISTDNHKCCIKTIENHYNTIA